MSEPVRLQLSRRKGFRLQAYSHAVNGLEAVNVARPSQWGNPFPVTDKFGPEEAVRDFRTYVQQRLVNGVGYPLMKAARLPVDETWTLPKDDASD